MDLTIRGSAPLTPTLYRVGRTSRMCPITMKKNADGNLSQASGRRDPSGCQHVDLPHKRKGPHFTKHNAVLLTDTHRALAKWMDPHGGRSKVRRWAKGFPSSHLKSIT